MIDFQETAGCYTVFVDGIRVGEITGDAGFFTSPAMVEKFVEISPADLRAIADKAEQEKNLYERSS